ncbi:ribbon-helix-helix protein, CopG family [bacterium]|nr:ribbon-helix-helix protein, CopG family [bacterium]
MPNITLRVDEEIIKKVRKIAIDRNTTMTAMIREFLQSEVEKMEIRKELAIKELEETFQQFSRDFGPRTWTREELHGR